MYMAVARMIYFRMPDRKLLGIKAIRTTVTFVWIDVILFIVQAGGGSMLSNDGDQNLTRIGQKIYMAGVGAQLGIIVIFSGLTVFLCTQASSSADPTASSPASAARRRRL